MGLYNNKNNDLINAIDLIKEKLKTENFLYFVYSSFYLLIQNSIFDNLDRIKEFESDILNMKGYSEYKNEYENLRKNKASILKPYRKSIIAYKSILSNINIESIKNYFIDNLEKKKEVFSNWMKDEEFFCKNYFFI